MTDALEIAAWYDNNPVVQGMIMAAYERGVAAGRTQAAADIRAHRNEPTPFTPNPIVRSDSWWSGYEEAKEDAARIAEGSTDGT